MKLRSLLLAIAGCFALTACGDEGWTPPVYSGHQESTEGVPGFHQGQKKSPYVKLGQSYKVMGEWYVPRFQPDYNETGLASWYGPGFHGGKTANGERFDKHSMTAAHKTLPLPSIVKVTMLETGKTVIVRINDRGPFSKGRIIDLSYAAAQEIGLIKKGTAKVRVEYMLNESQRFADLLAQGRAPESINLASEVLPYGQQDAVDVAAAEIKAKANKPVTDTAWWDDLNPIGEARAGTPTSPYANSAPSAAPTDAVATHDLSPPPSGTVMPTRPVVEDSPFAAMQTGSSTQVASSSTEIIVPTVTVGSSYVQLGTYGLQQNAQALSQRMASIGPSNVYTVQRDNLTLYRVRLGPYDNPQAAEEVLARVHEMGMVDARLIRE